MRADGVIDHFRHEIRYPKRGRRDQASRRDAWTCADLDEQLIVFVNHVLVTGLADGYTFEFVQTVARLKRCLLIPALGSRNLVTEDAGDIHIGV